MATVTKTAVKKKVGAPKAKPGKTFEQKTKPEKTPTIKSLVRDLFTEDPAISTPDMIAEVQAQFPDSKFDATHVAFYRGWFRKHEDMDIPSQRTVKAEEKEAGIKTPAVGKKKGLVPAPAKKKALKK